jgi:hypothetical protein
MLAPEEPAVSLGRLRRAGNGGYGQVEKAEVS